MAWLRLFVTIGVAVLAIALLQSHVLVVLEVGVSFSAKTVCSGVFVSKLPPSTFETHELSGLPGLVSDITIDLPTKSVTATTLFGFVKAKSVFHSPGFGCVIVHEQDKLPSWSVLRNLNKQIGEEIKSTRDLAWPTGDKINQTQLELSLNGVDLPAINAAIDREFSDEQIRTRAIVVLHRGQLIAERYLDGINKHTPLIGWSMTKSVLSTLIGIWANQRGLMAEDLSMISPLAVEWENDERGERDLLKMLQMRESSSFVEQYGAYGDVTDMLFRKSDAGAFAANFSSRPVSDPKQEWAYSSGTTNILSRFLRTQLGHSRYWRFPREQLFSMIGMDSAVMETDESGTFVASSFSYATARDWARFGLLHLQNGLWVREIDQQTVPVRLLPPDWLKFISTPAIGSAGYYGGHWWLGGPNNNKHNNEENLVVHNEHEKLFLRKLPPGTLVAHGFDQQIVAVVPTHGLVVVRLGLKPHNADWEPDQLINSIVAAVPEYVTKNNDETDEEEEEQNRFFTPAEREAMDKQAEELIKQQQQLLKEHQRKHPQQYQRQQHQQ